MRCESMIPKKAEKNKKKHPHESIPNSSEVIPLPLIKNVKYHAFEFGAQAI